MTRAIMAKLPFLLAVALIAAATGDVLVESVSNTGIFGGAVDNNHIGIVPAMLGGLVIVAEVALLRCTRALSHGSDAPRTRFADVARDLSARPLVPELMLVFAMQIMALFCMESVEQLTVGGSLLGGLVWVGGPLVFSLVVHALVGVCCTVALRVVMRLVVEAFSAIVRSALYATWLALSRSTAAFTHRRRPALRLRAQAPYAQQAGGRAPPLLLISA